MNVDALEHDLRNMIATLEDIEATGYVNDQSNQMNLIQLSFQLARIAEIQEQSETLQHYVNANRLAIGTTDLDYIVSSQTDLQSFLWYLELDYQQNINLGQELFGREMHTAPPGSPQQLRLQIAQVENQIAVLTTRGEYGAIPTTWPTEGRVSSGFGVRNDPFTNTPAFHTGTDIAAPTGTPVTAWFNGTVQTSPQTGGWGQQIVTQQGDLRVRYAHLSVVYVEPGDQVTQGQLIGRVGSTGRSTAPHLHLGLYLRGLAVDPQRIINRR